MNKMEYPNLFPNNIDLQIIISVKAFQFGREISLLPCTTKLLINSSITKEGSVAACINNMYHMFFYYLSLTLNGPHLSQITVGLKMTWSLFYKEEVEMWRWWQWYNKINVHFCFVCNIVSVTISQEGLKWNHCGQYKIRQEKGTNYHENL